MALTQVPSGMLASSAQFYSFKNRIINGAMVIDQRNGGVSGTAVGYTVDRWGFVSSLSTKGTWQQNAGGATPPAGFINYLGFTSNSAYTLGSGDYFTFAQYVEGLNVSDLGWGAANAQTITLSAWVRSSLTGTFSGAVRNSANDYSYVFTYSIPTANTWTQINITIAGPTSGTWLTTNGIGLRVFFSMGMGTTFSTTAGSWQAGTYAGLSSATSVVGTSGATFYITGVQLEKGSTATSFDYRPYGTELALCQRYFQINGGTSGFPFVQGAVNAANDTRASFPFPVSMRATPTTTIAGTWASTNINGVARPALSALGTEGYVLQTYSTSAGGYYYYPNSADDIMTFSAEL